MALAMAAKKGISAPTSQDVWGRPSAGVIGVVFIMIIVSMQVGGGSADSTVLNLSKATMSVNDFVLEPEVGQLTIAISSGGSALIDLSYTKNITGVKIQDGKEYYVVPNQAGTTAILSGLSVVTVDLIEAKIIEEAF
ncbi:hypothetical protein M758_6G004200 [Ceratodon purpureus]|uniref:Uncharacterized protein n=1 Tax=Ceratodon purpureus TaxID=3225 RepID=A0A8T0HDL0_CERPU|nr:hypothetical protein KC19_6G004400 [Ceratodon purpureus]KAG0612131.1 hypothetical protein M758_6G004200 [Ceratodon purpureus]